MSRIHWRDAVSVLLAPLIGACGSSDLTAPSRASVGYAMPRGGQVDVSGRVIDFTTMSGVANAIVAFGKYGPDLGITTLNEHKTTADASGNYRLMLTSGEYYVYVDGQIAALFNLRDVHFRGDVLVRAGDCSARYGMIVDSRSGQPIADVRVSLAGFETLSDASGWYRLDIGCFSSYGIGTTFISFTRTGYAERTIGAGRAETLAGLRRIDAALERR